MSFKLYAAAVLAASTAVGPLAAQAAPERPKITGVSHLAIYAADMAATEHYFVHVVGAVKMPDPENPAGVKYALSGTQYVEVLPLPADAGVSRMDHAAFNTTSAEGMRNYLAAKDWKTPAKVSRGTDGSLWFAVHDPEGNKIEFVQPPAGAQCERAQCARASHHSRGLCGARPGQGRHVLSRAAGLSAVLVWRHERRED